MLRAGRSPDVLWPQLCLLSRAQLSLLWLKFGCSVCLDSEMPHAISSEVSFYERQLQGERAASICSSRVTANTFQRQLRKQILFEINSHKK